MKCLILHRWANLIIAALCLGVWILVAWKMRWDLLLLGQTPMLDFDTYYQTAQDVISGYSPLSLPYMQTGGPPSVILPYLPFTLVSLPIARSIMAIISLLSIIFGAWTIASTAFKKHRLIPTMVIASLWLISFPARFNLGQGQPNLIIMAIFASLLTTTNSTKTSFLTSIAALIKTNYLVLFASLGLSKTLFKAIVTLLLLVGLGLWIIKPSYYLEFSQQRLGSTLNQSVNLMDVDYYNQSLKSTLSRFDLNQLYQPLFWLFALVSGVYLLITKDRSAGVILSLLLSPILWQHYVVVVYPVIISLLAENRNKRAVMIAILLAFILLMIEFPWLHHQSLTPINSVFGSHYFFGLLILVVVSIRSRLKKEPTAVIDKSVYN